jgi:hypothetical protein
MNNLSIQYNTVQVNVPSNSYEPNNFTHINNLEKKELQFPNTGKDFGLTKESNTIQEDIPQQEIWKSHHNFPGYIFSSFGRVYSYKARLNQFIEGSKNSYGYIQIDVKDLNGKRKEPFLSRVIYEIFGDDSTLFHQHQVDHIRSREKTNNNINNLRLADSKENNANKQKMSKNKKGQTCSSPYIGITWYKNLRKWNASIKIGKKRFHIGYFVSRKRSLHIQQNK